MKKTLLSLGCAFVLLAATNAKAGVQEDMSFGVELGGTFFPSIVDKTKKTPEMEGKWGMFLGGGAFFEYRLLDDMMSVGLDLGYAKRSIHLTPKSTGNNNNNNAKDTTKKADNKADINVDIHALDITVPVSFLPMEREGGLSIFVGPKMYLPLAKRHKEAGKDKFEDFKDEKKTIRGFNVGVVGGVEYEIEESGFFVGASYEYFFLDFYNDNEAVTSMKQNWGYKKEDKFRPSGLQAYVGYDVARLLE